MAARCICDDGTPAWCDVHGDLWYSDDGDQHLGATPADIVAARKAYDPEAIGAMPLAWQYPMLGLTVSWVGDDGLVNTRGLR